MWGEMKKLLIALLISMVAVVAWGSDTDPILPTGLKTFAYSDDASALTIQVSTNINLWGVGFGPKDIMSMSEEEIKNFIVLLRYYKLGIWMSDEFNMEINRKLLPRFFKKEPRP